MASEYIPEGIEQLNESGRANQSIIIDNGRYIAAVALCAIVCGGCAIASWWAIDNQTKIAHSYHDDTMTLQDEYQKVRNHTIELEARQKALADELQELKHVRR